MSRKKIAKIIKKLIRSLILVTYLTSSGIALYSKILRASGIDYSKYTIVTNYGSDEEANLLASKNLCYVIFTAKINKESYDEVMAEGQ